MTDGFSQRIQNGNGCVSTKYTFSPTGEMDRSNCYYDKSNSNLVCAKGTGVQVRNRPGVFDVSFQNGSSTTNRYTIMGTIGSFRNGFTGMAVYTCSTVSSTQARESVFILGRQNSMSDNDFRILSSSIRRNFIFLAPDNQLKKTDQTGCTYQE